MAVVSFWVHIPTARYQSSSLNLNTQLMLGLCSLPVMEDEIIVPVPGSVYKDEVWCHLGFCCNVRLGSADDRLPKNISYF